MRSDTHTNPTRYSRLASLVAGGTALAALVIAAPAVTAPALADTTPQASETAQATENGTTPANDLQMQGDFIVAQTPGHLLANDLIGADVVSADGESVGNVADVILDQDGRLAGITVSVGGFLGIGDREIGIPITAMGIGPEVEQTGSIAESGRSAGGQIDEVMINLDSAAIEDAPEFARLEDVPVPDNGTPVSPNGTPIGEPQID